MSALMDQARAEPRVPRIAEAAVERARLTVVPAAGARRAPRVPFVILVSLLLVGGVVGLLLFNTSMQQASFTATALEQQAAVLARPGAVAADGARPAARPAAGRRRAPRSSAWCRWSTRRSSGSPTARCSATRCPASTADALRLTPLPTRKPAELRPAAGRRSSAGEAPDTGVDGAPSDDDGLRGRYN